MWYHSIQVFHDMLENVKMGMLNLNDACIPDKQPAAFKTSLVQLKYQTTQAPKIH